MELLGIAPNWLLVWVVAWSIKRSVWEGAVAGVTLGLLQDGMSAAVPTHAISLGVVGLLTARLQRERVVQDDIISVLLIVFAMTVVGETVRALQFSLYAWRLPASAVFWSFEEIWRYYQEVALGSAVLNSLWSPVVYYPLNLLWERRFTSN
jgi:rod shape-determining protein MreD